MTPFVRVDADGHIVGDVDGKLSAEFVEYLNTIRTGTFTPDTASEIADEPNFGGVTVGGSVSGVIDANGDVDYYTVNLVAGQTYMVSLRGTGANPINDSFLGLINPAFTQYVALDDDGGNGLYSIITFTAAETGTYTIEAQTFDNATPDIGGYTIDVRQQGVDNVGDTFAGAPVIELGTTFNFIETSNDIDTYAVTLEAGHFYTFNVAGGADYNTDWFAVPPGELDTIMVLYGPDGSFLALNDDNSFPSDISSGLGFFAEESGTYYIDVLAYSGQTGGYALAFETVDLSAYDPLEALNWDSANDVTPDAVIDGVPTVYIYFAPAGENLTSETNAGWQQNEIDAVMHALSTVYTPLTGYNYVITDDASEATFRMMTVADASYGARFYPQDPAYGSLQGIGSFNLGSGGFRDFPQSLEPGGFSYAVILHEFGHAHGIAHPHDGGGGSEVMLGVTGATGSFGVFDLNQGVYTVMSYNDAWQRHPDGPSAFTVAGIDNGWSSTLGALDVAVMQARYGVQPTNEGNTVYQLTDIADDANYRTIVDTGGNDTIAYSGAFDAQIDLTAATLDYSPTGGGVISFLYNPQPYEVTNSFLVRGGFTIANGVVIENATGGSGDDILIGNSANNVLTGNAGDDFLMGGAGADTLNGGAGFDTASYRTSSTGVTVSLPNSASQGDAQGDTLISIEALEGSEHDDVLGGGNADDTLSGLGGNDQLTGRNGIDTLLGGAGDDVLDGGNGDDFLDGGDGDDILIGGNGVDTLNGGAGDDVLDGGRGEDIYVFAHAGTDTIVGYQRGEDIDLSALDVTIDDVTIFNNRIVVDLEGDDDLTIMFNTRGFSTDDLIFDDAAVAADAAAAAFSAAAMTGGFSHHGDYLLG